MAIPASPPGFYSVQGNGEVYLQWDNVAGATSYSVERSTDGVTYASIGSPTVNNYTDNTVSLGTLYYYQVASVNSSGTSGFTDPQSLVPTMGGEMSLSELDIRARQRADRLESDFISTPEMISYINLSLSELYDILVTAYEDYYKAPGAIFTTTNTQGYPMPNGVLSFTAEDGSSFVPEPIYKLLGVDLSLGGTSNGWLTLEKYNFAERNKYVYPNTGAPVYGVYNLAYRWMGNKIEFIPAPTSGQTIRLQYIPKLPLLIKPQDLTTTNVSGWLEYVIVDVAIKILQKEESDVTVLMLQKQALKDRIQQASQNKDAGRPDTISDVRGVGGSSGGFGYFGRGW